MDNPLAADVIAMLLLTGAKRFEVLGARWGRIDLEPDTWTKPPTATKYDVKKMVY